MLKDIRLCGRDYPHGIGSIVAAAVQSELNEQRGDQSAQDGALFGRSLLKHKENVKKNEIEVFRIAHDEIGVNALHKLLKDLRIFNLSPQVELTVFPFTGCEDDFTKGGVFTVNMIFCFRRKHGDISSPDLCALVVNREQGMAFNKVI